MPEDLKVAGAIYARVGERVTCENGHVVAIVVDPLVLGKQVDLKVNLASWNIPTSLPFSKTCVCGAPWFRFSGEIQDFQYHFAGGWRPEPVAALDLGLSRPLPASLGRSYDLSE